MVTEQGSASVQPKVMVESLRMMTTNCPILRSRTVSVVRISKLRVELPLTKPYMSLSLVVHRNLCLLKVKLPSHGTINVELAATNELDTSSKT